MKHSIALPTIAAVTLFLVFASFTPAALAQPQSLLTHHVRDVTLNGRPRSLAGSPQPSPCASILFFRCAKG
jgi:hypothetical protein